MGIEYIIFSFLNFITSILLPIILILIFVTLISKVFSKGPLEKDVLERWSAYLPDHAKSQQEFFDVLESELDIKNSPFKAHLVSLKSSFSDSSMAVRIRYNRYFHAFVGANTVGNDLSITWVLYEKPSILFSIPIIGPLLFKWWNIVTIADRNKVIAFAVFIKTCAENVVDSFADKSKLDKTKLVKTFSGKLGPL